MPQNVTYAEIIPRVVYFVIWSLVTVFFFVDMFAIGKENTLPMYAKGLLIGGFALLSLLYLWSYYVCCCGDAGSVEQFYKSIGVLEDIRNGEIPEELASLPLCDKCGLPKPERTHHCGTCNQCYFRFDHHCPIMGNCIAFYNFKAFILMPIYGFFVLALLAVEICLVHQTWLGLFFIPLPLCFLMFSFSYCQSVCENSTTFEQIVLKKQGVDVNYNEGCYRNYIQLFGGFLGFMLPTRPTVTGFHWCGDDTESHILRRKRRMDMRTHLL